MQAVLRLATIAVDWCIAANSASLEPAAKARDLKSPAKSSQKETTLRKSIK
jgi:hypothetical protein